MKASVGSFDDICQTAALAVCPLIESVAVQGIEPACYSLSLETPSTIIFQPFTCVAHAVAIIMTIIIILHIRAKYLAVGRKEIVTLFYLYALLEFLAIILDGGLVPTFRHGYPVVVAMHTGLVSACYTCLLINSFVGFRYVGDGSFRSLWLLRIAIMAAFILSFFLSLATLEKIGSVSLLKPTMLWLIYIVWPLICVVVYGASQIFLIFRKKESLWPLGTCLLGLAFFALAQIFLFGFNVAVCESFNHYVDGMFFSTIWTLLTVMMLYKYWDSTTNDDFELTAAIKPTVWEKKYPSLMLYWKLYDSKEFSYPFAPPPALVAPGGTIAPESIYGYGAFYGNVFLGYPDFMYTRNE